MVDAWLDSITRNPANKLFIMPDIVYVVPGATDPPDTKLAIAVMTEPHQQILIDAKENQVYSPYSEKEPLEGSRRIVKYTDFYGWRLFHHRDCYRGMEVKVGQTNGGEGIYNYYKFVGPRDLAIHSVRIGEYHALLRYGYTRGFGRYVCIAYIYELQTFLHITLPEMGTRSNWGFTRDGNPIIDEYTFPGGNGSCILTLNLQWFLDAETYFTKASISSQILVIPECDGFGTVMIVSRVQPMYYVIRREDNTAFVFGGISAIPSTPIISEMLDPVPLDIQVSAAYCENGMDSRIARNLADQLLIFPESFSVSILRYLIRPRF